MKAKHTAPNKLPHTPEAPESGNLPEELKGLAVTPIQALEELAPKAAASPEGREVLAAFCSGIGVNFGVPLPDWVKLASTRLWEGFGMDFQIDALTDEDVGKLVGLMERLPPSGSSEPTPLRQAAKAFPPLAKRAMDDEPPAVAHAFHGGRVKAETIVGKMTEPSNRTKIFLLITLGWREVEKFKCSSELRKWLYSQMDSNGNRTIASCEDDGREVRAICKMIGLRYPHRGGRPRKKN